MKPTKQLRLKYDDAETQSRNRQHDDGDAETISWLGNREQHSVA
jgi:hypothetical protein